jgi:chromate transporter
MTVALLGWHVYGVFGALLAIFAISWPSAILVFYMQRCILRIEDPIKKKTIQYAAGALAIGLVLSSALQITLQINRDMAANILTVATIVLVLLTRWHPLYLIALGAALGLFGFI